jgi:hypothetical protein
MSDPNSSSDAMWDRIGIVLAYCVVLTLFVIGPARYALRFLN